MSTRTCNISKLVKSTMKPSENKKAYEDKLSQTYDEQYAKMQKRKAENLANQKKVTEEIVSKIKKEILKEKKKAENKDSLYVPAEPTYIVAIQIKSMNGVNPKQKKTLQLLRFNKINTCVILKNNECTRKMLQIAKDSVAYGFVDYEMLRKLVYLRGCGKIGHSRVKLTNETIEDAFQGKYKCIESLLDVVYHGKKDMKKVLNFLVPMKLNSPKGKYCNGRKLKTFIQGGVAGDHKELLSNLLVKMI